ncbi:MAG: hypothetical protein ACRELY_25350 [Polyangiaceae bacterium]
MLLAGGALAIAGCPGTTQESDFDASASGDAGSDVSPFCCNANGDPCCTFEYCGAAMSAACACKLDGGTLINMLVDGGGPINTCVFDAGNTNDEDDAATDDAGADADVTD